MGRTTGVRFPAGARNFCCLRSVPAASGAHPISDPIGTGGSFRGGKAARELATRLFPVPSSKTVELYLHSPYVLWRGA
jgi:hypothetical protein